MFEFKSDQLPMLKNLLLNEFEKKFGDNEVDLKVNKKRVTELKTLLEKVEEKYVTDMVTRAQYERLSTKYRDEIKILERETEKIEQISSNLEKSVSKGLSLAQKISKIWGSSDFGNKQKLQ